MSQRNRQLAGRIKTASQLIKRAAAGDIKAVAKAAPEVAEASKSILNWLKNLSLFGGGAGVGAGGYYLTERIKKWLEGPPKPPPPTPVGVGPVLRPLDIGYGEKPGALFDLSELLRKIPQLSHVPKSEAERAIRQLSFGTLEIPTAQATPQNILTQIGYNLKKVPDLTYAAGYVATPEDDRKLKIYYSLVALATSSLKPPGAPSAPGK